MAESNLDIVRRSIDAFQEGDLGTWLAAFDEHVVWVPLRNHPEPEPRHGREAALVFAEEWVGPWDNYKFDTTRLDEIGDAVLWTARFIATNEGSTMRADEEMTCAFSMSRGRIVKLEWFWNREEALARLEEDVATE